MNKPKKKKGELLVVDDTPANLKLLMDILVAEGYKIRPATDGEQALAAVAARKPELIMLDIKMPDMDGYEVCRRLKADEHTRDIPVIFISAYDSLDDRVKGFDVGGVDFINKPFQKQDVLVRVHNHLQLYRMQMDLEGIVQERTVELLAEITERKRVEEALFEANRIINRSPAVAFLWKNEKGWPVEFVSENVKTLFEYSAQEFLEGKISYTETVHSDDLEKVGEEVVHFSNKKDTQTFTHEPYRIITRSGDIKWIEDITYIRRDARGDVTHYEGIVYDITERKETQDELNRLRRYLGNIINSMPSMLIGVNTKNEITQWNAEAKRVTGVSAENAIGMRFDEVVPHLSEEIKRVQLAMETRQEQTSHKRILQKDGGIHYEDITIYPLITNGVEDAVIRVDDVTARVRLEEMMIQSEKMLSIGGLAAGMAHEINNPLAGMMQTASVMANRLSETANIPANMKAARAVGITMESIQSYMEARGIPRMIKTISESGQRVADIVDNMLSFARKSESQRSSHDMADMMDKTLDLATTDYDLKKQFDFKMIEIEKQYENDLPRVPCEGAKIQQVLLNILRNGAQAMQLAMTSKPRFIIRIRFEAGREMVFLEIEDNGPGMDEVTRKRIFEPFFTTKPEGLGTGLGLSVSYFIITENHGGEIVAESLPGEGAKFIIRLPIERRRHDDV